MNLKDILRRRSDLSTFIVHMTREYEKSAKENLINIINTGILDFGRR